MEDLVKQFNFENNDLTVIHIDGEPWFVAKEIGMVLGYAEDGKRFVRNISEKWKDEFDEDMLYKLEGEKLQWFKEVRQVTETVTRQPVDYTRLNSLLLISEQGIYQAIILSKKPIGKKLRKWLSKDVLPAIRKTGGYLDEAVDVENDPILMAIKQATMLGQQALKLREGQIEQAKKIKALEDDMEEIKQVRRDAEEDLKRLPPSTVPAAEKSTRAALNKLVRSYSKFSGVECKDVWVDLYEELYYRCHFDVNARYRNNQNKGRDVGLKKLDIIEKNEMLPQLYAIAKEMLVVNKKTNNGVKKNERWF